MKRKIMFFILLAVVLVFTGCMKKKSIHAVLVKNIEYDVSINNFMNFCKNGLKKSNMWYQYNLEGSVHTAFIDLLIKNALNGKLELTDMNGKPIDAGQVKKLLSVNDTVKYRPYPPHEIYDTVVTSIIETAQITALRFRETWEYDPATMAITKKIIAIAPIMTPVYFDKNYNDIYGKEKALFWIKFSKEPTKTKVLTKRIMSQVVFWGKNIPTAINFDSATVSAYIKKLFDMVYADKIPAYECLQYDMAVQQLSGKEWNSSINHVDTMYLPLGSHSGKPDSMIVVKTEREYQALRFLEEWYFDPKTIAIQKKVVGVCPVSLQYSENYEFKGYLPILWTYFTDIWEPFDGKLELKKKK